MDFEKLLMVITASSITGMAAWVFSHGVRMSVLEAKHQFHDEMLAEIKEAIVKNTEAVHLLAVLVAKRRSGDE